MTSGHNPIKVNANPEADRYATQGVEKIIEFDSPNGGGLIAFRVMDDGTLRVESYRLDATVVVVAPERKE